VGGKAGKATTPGCWYAARFLMRGYVRGRADEQGADNGLRERKDATYDWLDETLALRRTESAGSYVA
jgi:hypothetical protein